MRQPPDRRRSGPQGTAGRSTSQVTDRPADTDTVTRAGDGGPPRAADLLDQALAYAARGWPVFPCKPGRKEPDTASGFLDATTDPARDPRAGGDGTRPPTWRSPPAHPAADVLDVDVKPGGPASLPSTASRPPGMLTGASTLVRTRSGGLHLYFTGTRQPCGRLPGTTSTSRPRAATCSHRRRSSRRTPPAGRYELLDERARPRASSTGNRSGACSTRRTASPAPSSRSRSGGPGRMGGSACPKATATRACTGPRAGWPRPAATLSSSSPPLSRPGYPRPRHGAPCASAARRAAG